MTAGYTRAAASVSGMYHAVQKNEQGEWEIMEERWRCCFCYFSVLGAEYHQMHCEILQFFSFTGFLQKKY